MDTLTKVMDVNQHQIDELARHPEAFGQIRNKAVEVVPEIREQINMTGAWMMFRFSKWFGFTDHRRAEHRLRDHEEAECWVWSQIGTLTHSCKSWKDV